MTDGVARWTKAEDGLPDNGTECVIDCGDGDVYHGLYLNGDWRTQDGFTCTAIRWCAVPADGVLRCKVATQLFEPRTAKWSPG